jgi:type VI secretion system protein ImpL
MTVTPPPLIGTGLKAKLEVNGVPVESPTTIQWVASFARSAITIIPDAGGSPVVIEGKPPGTAWSFFRLLDLGSPSPRGNGVVARYSGYAQPLEYQFVPQTLSNPLLLSDLREFKCPRGL